MSVFTVSPLGSIEIPERINPFTESPSAKSDAPATSAAAAIPSVFFIANSFCFFSGVPRN